MRFLMAFAMLAAMACAPVSTTTSAASLDGPQTPVSAPKPADEASCKTAGGDWRPICRMQQPACVFSYRDAGKACSDGDDCAGDCIVKGGEFASDGKAATGVCSASSDPCGCKQKIEDGKTTAAICVD